MPAIEVSQSLRRLDVILTPSRLRPELMCLYGKPAFIRSDNGRLKGNMDEIEQLKKQNADLQLALQQTRNATVDEVALMCERLSNFAFSHEELTSAIRAMKDGTPAAASAAGLPNDWQLVLDEVERATRKFPTWPTDPLHAIAVLGEEFGELTKAVLQTTYEPHKVQEGELRTEAIQTAAMALRFLASLGRYEFVPCTQHEQSSGDRTSGKGAGDQA